MNGKLLKEQVRILLNEDSGSGFLDDKTTFDFLYEAACQTVEVLQCLKTQATITTIAETSNYNLPSNFLNLFVRDQNNELFVKYYDGNTYSFVRHDNYQNIVYNNNTTSQSIPNKFSIINCSSLASNVTGTATSAGDKTGGKSVLTDTTQSFLTSVSVGDVVHNVTDSSYGFVVSVTSNSVISTCLFNGTDNEWDVSDSFIITPQARLQIVVDPLSKTAGHSIIVNYIQKPNLVYSDYDTYNIPQQYFFALVKYAAWLYKYRDQEPQFGNAWYQFWDRSLRNNNSSETRTSVRPGFKVNRKKRS